MAWRRLGDKPLYEPMMVGLLTHICVTRPQWVNILVPDKTWYHLIYVTEPVIAAGNRLSPIAHQARTNTELLLIGLFGTSLCEFVITTQRFSFKKLHFKTSSAHCRSFCSRLEQILPYFTWIHFRLWLYVLIERNPYLEEEWMSASFLCKGSLVYNISLLIRIIVWFHIITHVDIVIVVHSCMIHFHRSWPMIQYLCS